MFKLKNMKLKIWFEGKKPSNKNRETKFFFPKKKKHFFFQKRN